jgi:hypothetical protein
MTTASSKDSLLGEAETSVDAVAAEIQRAARQELDDLRRLIGSRLVAIEQALDRNRNDPAFDPIVNGLCEAAAAQADAAATAARVRAEEAAARVLAEARDAAQAELDAARKQHEAARAESESMRSDLERRLALAEAAEAEASAELAGLQTQADTARARIHTLEKELAELALARDVVEAHLEGEVQARTTLAGELDAVREMALYAQTDADTSRLALQKATGRIRLLEERHRKLDAEPRRSARATTGDAGEMLDQVRDGLQTLTATTTGRGLLDALVETLAQRFSSVAWCVVTAEDYVVPASRGFDPPLQSRERIPMRADSPLTRALAEWKPATVRAAHGRHLPGLSGRPAGYAIALPIVTQNHGAVMLYAENPPESSTEDPDVAAKIAVILADHVRRRLSKKAEARATRPGAHSPERQAPRVRIMKNVNVTLDGAPSALVDLSAHGAQVISARAISPNHSVQITLPNGNGGLSCEARVVWVVVEPGQDDRNALYRAGIQFRGADAPELRAFASKHGILEPAIKH